MPMATPPPSAIDLGSLTLDSFRGRPVAVLGLARSGLALARFLEDRGAHVTVYDALPADALTDAVAALGERRPRLLLGPDIDPRVALDGQALICTSPSVSSRYPTTEPRLRAALAAVEAAGRVPLVSEVDLFLRLCPAATVGVTGTKGKTTTSSLAAAVLAGGHAPVLLGGNIGRPLIERLPGLTAAHRVVLELSELQLPTLSRGTDVAVYTHVTSDHLDRHGNEEAYRVVKRRLVELLPSGGALVRDDDDPVVSSYRAPAGSLTVTYARTAPGSGGVGVADGWIVAREVPRLAVAGGGLAETVAQGRILPLDEIPVPGWHNVSNVLAATAVGLLHGVSPDAIRAAVRAFPGVEHRLELVASVAGVRYVNDSQGTQPDAVMAALRSFPAPLVLIAGGRSKGVPIDELARVVAARVSAAVLIGESGPQLAEAFSAAGLAHIEQAGTMDEAVRRATDIARAMAPAVVLLSPAAASFDMFRDYEARGAAFKAAVAAIAGEAAGSAGGAAAGAAGAAGAGGTAEAPAVGERKRRS
jgi:UDP-N-acetylmuramoylalanine--D-glutamate ligase